MARVSGVRWTRRSIIAALAEDAVCLLDVPVHKTGRAFAKPVDRAVGMAALAANAGQPAGRTSHVAERRWW